MSAMMKSYSITFVVLLVVVSKYVIFCNKNETLQSADKLNQPSNGESNSESAESEEAVASIISKTDASLDPNVITTTYRSVRVNSSTSSPQERDTKLMSLLAARRSALHRDRFRTHRRVVTTGRTRTTVETTSKSPPDSRTVCVRNCTKNFTRRTTASCMRQCASIQRQSNATSSSNSTSDEEKIPKDNNEILFTDESSHGFFVVAKDINDTVNHIPELGKVAGTYKTRSRGKQNSSIQVSDADSYLFFGRKIPSLRPSFLTISTVNEEHPQVLEVSVSQAPLKQSTKPKSSNKFSPRDRNVSQFNRKINGAKLASLVAPAVTNLKQGDASSVAIDRTTRPTVELNAPKGTERTTSTEPPRLLENITPSLLVENAKPSTEATRVEVSTPLIISVIDEGETTYGADQEYSSPPTGYSDEDIDTETNEAPHLPEDKTNLIVFVNRSMEAETTPPPAPTPKATSSNETDGMTIVNSTILSSVRSTVHPPISTSKTPDVPSTEKEVQSTMLVEKVIHRERTTSNYDDPDNTKQSFSEGIPLPDGSEVTPGETRRLNIATYVLAGLGMFPVLIVILYLTKSLILKGYSKHDEDFDVCITDQQPISPVKKIEKYEEEGESGQYEHCSISSMDEFNRGNLRLKSLLGEGNFGKVWKAEADDLSGHVGATRIVAVKTVRSGSTQDGLKEEATIMRKLGSHPNVVTLLGACIETEPHMLIMEFAMRGRLLSLLRAARSATNILPASVPGGRSLAPLSPRTLAGFALDIAAGMEYIAGKKIVHRDLAARNVLIDHNGICKICDFGMSMDLEVMQKKRETQSATDIMRTNSSKFDKLKFDIGERFINHWSHSLHTHNTKKSHDTLGRRPALPIRWMAPESLQFNEFSTETDVWAFGIVLWEIATLGATPYANLSGREVVRHVLQGTRPEIPKDGRHGFFELMSQCWHKLPELRPTFREARLEISRSVCKWLDDDAAASDYMDVSGFSEDLEHGMVYFNQRISEFECEI